MKRERKKETEGEERKKKKKRKKEKGKRQRRNANVNAACVYVCSTSERRLIGLYVEYGANRDATSGTYLQRGLLW